MMIAGIKVSEWLEKHRKELTDKIDEIKQNDLQEGLFVTEDGEILLADSYPCTNSYCVAWAEEAKHPRHNADDVLDISIDNFIKEEIFRKKPKMKNRTETYIMYADIDGENNTIYSRKELEEVFNENEYENELFKGDFEAWLNEYISLGAIHKISYYEKRKDELREEAKEWQNNFDNETYSWEDLLKCNYYFEKYGKRYGLLKEFRENGIC